MTQHGERKPLLVCLAQGPGAPVSAVRLGLRGLQVALYDGGSSVAHLGTGFHSRAGGETRRGRGYRGHLQGGRGDLTKKR